MEILVETKMEMEYDKLLDRAIELLEYSGSKTYAARLLGQLGGSAKSERKTAACRENAKKPRPNRKPRKPVMQAQEPFDR